MIFTVITASLLWADPGSSLIVFLIEKRLLLSAAYTHFRQIKSSCRQSFLKWEGERPVTFLNWWQKCDTLL